MSSIHPAINFDIQNYNIFKDAIKRNAVLTHRLRDDVSSEPHISAWAEITGKTLHRHEILIYIGECKVDGHLFITKSKHDDFIYHYKGYFV